MKKFSCIYIGLSLLSTTFTSAQFKKLDTDFPAIFYDVVFLNDSKGFTVGKYTTGPKGFLAATTDGQNWTNINTRIDTSSSFQAIDFADSVTGYISGYEVGGKTALYKTTDGGLTWATLNFTSPRVSIIHDLDFTTTQIGYMVGYKFSGNKLNILKTVDGGLTWTDKSADLFSSVGSTGRRLKFANSNSGVVVGDEALVAGTFNGGDTWNDIRPMLTPEFTNVSFYDVVIVSDSTIVAVGKANTNEGIIAKTTNLGMDWQLISIETPIYGIAFTDSINAYAAGKGPYVYETSDGGESWRRTTLYGISASYESVTVAHDSIIYIVGTNGNIVTNKVFPPKEEFDINFTLANTVCQNNLTMINNLSTLSENFQWYINDSLFSTEESPSLIFNEVGNYVIKLVGDSIGSNGMVRDSFSKSIMVAPFSNAEFSVPDTVEVGENIIALNETDTATDYEWYVNNNFVATSKNLTYPTFEIGTITFRLIAKNILSGSELPLCTDSSVVKNVVVIDNDTTTSIALNDANNLNIYPNPANNLVFLKGNINKYTTYKIYNSLGKIVKTDHIKDEKIDVSSLLKGFYFIEIENEKIYLRKRLVILR